MGNTCIVVVLSLALGLALGGFCFDYSLDAYFGKDIPWYGDCAAGVVGIAIVIPATVVGYVLVECDQPTPIFYPEEKSD